MVAAQIVPVFASDAAALSSQMRSMLNDLGLSATQPPTLRNGERRIAGRCGWLGSRSQLYGCALPTGVSAMRSRR